MYDNFFSYLNSLDSSMTFKIFSLTVMSFLQTGDKITKHYVSMYHVASLVIRYFL